MPVRPYPRVIWLQSIKPASMTKTDNGTLYTSSCETPVLVTRETENDWIGTAVEEVFNGAQYPEYVRRHMPVLSYWSKKNWKDSQQEDDLKPFVRKIADGKLLMRYSSMTANVTCDCCGSEEKIEYSPDFPDTLKHKSWCVVTAARTFFPGFEPSPYPENQRRWGISNEYNGKPEFAWLASEAKEEVSSNVS